MEWDSSMDFQGAQEEPEGRPGGPGKGKRARSDPPSWGPLVLLAVLLALPWVKGAHPASAPLAPMLAGWGSRVLPTTKVLLWAPLRALGPKP